MRNGKYGKISRINIFTRLEMIELPKLLLPGEQVLGVIAGFYSAGTAILCATSLRLLLIDKKIMRMNIEDVRYEAISEIDYGQQLFVASTRIYFAGRELQFRSLYRRELRILTQFVQGKMFETRSLQQTPDQPFSGPSPQVVMNTMATNNPALQSQQTAITPQMEQHLRDRITRWRHASRFIDNLESSK